MRPINWTKYVLAFLITGAIFGTAFYTADYFNNKRIAELQNIEDRISTDILSLETQFDLLSELSCQDINENSVLSQELNSLASRLSYTESQLGADNAEVERLKRSYSLLQIKDFVLMKRVSEKCKLDPVFIFYFYSNKGDCPRCEDEGYVLTYMREQYPKLRIYAFDYNLDLSAIRTLIAIYDIKNNPPSLVINGKVYYGFQDKDTLGKIIPGLEQFREATSTATTTATSTR